jgi:hypothetical protein
MAATLTGGASGNYLEIYDATHTTVVASGYATNRHTIAIWMRPTSALPSNAAFVFSETVTNSSGDTYHFGIKFTNSTVIGRFKVSGSSIDVSTSAKACAINQDHLIILERDGDTLNIFVDSDATPGTANGCGTAAYTTMTGFSLGRAPITGESPTLTRWTGRVAYATGFQRKLSRIEQLRLWNAGKADIRPFMLTQPSYCYPLNDRSGAQRAKFSLTEVTGGTAVAFTDNNAVTDTAFSEAVDPVRVTPASLIAAYNPVALWDFQEANPGPFVDEVAGMSLARDTTAGNGADGNIVRAFDGVLGAFSIRLDQVGLVVPEADCGPVKFPGASRFTAIAWIKTFSSVWVSNAQTMGLIAGRWDEQAAALGDRQWGLWHSLRDLNDNAVIMPSATVNCHTSDDGGITEPYSFNYEVSASGESFIHGRWACAAITWDRGTSRSFIDGRFMPGFRNPYMPGYTELFNSTAPFRVGGNLISGTGTWGNWFNGDIGGLMVCNRVLSDADIFNIAAQTIPTANQSSAGSSTGGRRIIPLFMDS